MSGGADVAVGRGRNLVGGNSDLQLLRFTFLEFRLGSPGGVAATCYECAYHEYTTQAPRKTWQRAFDHDDSLLERMT
jgi:hypothetical protein